MKRSIITNKFMALLLCISVMVSMVTGCAGGRKDSSADSVDTADDKAETVVEPKESGRADKFVFGISTDISGLSCFDPVSSGRLLIEPMLYDTLFCQMERGGQLCPGIAKEYTMEENDDTATITIELFDYVKDWNGQPITASDVVFSYNTLLNSGNFANSYYMQSIEAIDDYTVEMVITGYNKLGVVEALLTACCIVSEASYDAEKWPTDPVGTGPYKIQEFVSGATTTLVVNEDYWQTDESYIIPLKARNANTIVFKVILEDAQLALALETGDVDAINTVSTDNLKFFIDDEGNSLEGYYTQSSSSHLVVNIVFSMNSSSNVANDLYLRQAILYGIDKSSIVNTVASNTAKEVFCYGVPISVDYNPEWETADYYNYDIEKATELLEKSDYKKNGSPTIRILYEAQDTKQRAAQMLMGYLQAIGVNCELLPCDTALFDNYKNNFGEWDIRMDNYGDRSGYLAGFWPLVFNWELFQYDGSGCDISGGHNEELQELLEIAGNTKTMSQEATNAIHEYITDNAIGYGLWCPVIYYAAQDGITDMKLWVNFNIIPNAVEFASDYRSNVQ